MARTGGSPSCAAGCRRGAIATPPLRPLLIGLIEQRLRSRGLRLDTDDEAARAALGEALTNFVDHPPAKRAYDPAPLSDLLTRIESL